MRSKHQRCYQSSCVYCLGLGVLCVDLILIGPRHEVVDTVYWMILDAFEDPSKSGFGIYLVHLGSLNERISYSGRFAACF